MLRLLRPLKLKYFALRHPDVASIIRRVESRHLTYLSTYALTELARVAIANEQSGIKGIIIEAGCALGGSAIVLASAKACERPFYVYDVFGMIPPPSEQDGQDACERYAVIKSGQSSGIGGKCYYGYEENLYERVQRTFGELGLDLATNSTHLVKGLYEDTLRVEASVALAHIDCDWYESVITCLHRIEPYLVQGGTLIIDDYDRWSGCKRAVDDYFLTNGKRGYEFKFKSRLHIVKK